MSDPIVDGIVRKLYGPKETDITEITVTLQVDEETRAALAHWHLIDSDGDSWTVIFDWLASSVIGTIVEAIEQETA